jgi:hypothetical protein
VRRWWWLVALLALSVGLNLGLLAATLAGRWLPRREPAPVELGPRGAAPGPAQLRRVAERLGLEGEEARRFVALQEEFLDRARQARRRLEESRRGLRQELAAPSPDPARVEALVAASAAAHTELERALATHVLAARELLDGEAEAHYLRLLSRLGTGARRPGGPGPAGRQLRRPRPQAP